jgi:hypothetical protein
MAARRINGAHSGTVGGVLVENRHQTRSAEIVADQEGSESRDAVSSESGIAQGICVRRTETTADSHGANVSVNAKTPIDWTSAVNKGKAAVAREFLDICRNSVTI